MITVDDMRPFGFVIVCLFTVTYPDGTTLEQMKADAPNHGWIRLVLKEWGEDYE